MTVRRPWSIILSLVTANTVIFKWFNLMQFLGVGDLKQRKSPKCWHFQILISRFPWITDLAIETHCINESSFFSFIYILVKSKKTRRTKDWFKIRSLHNNLFLTVLYMIIYPLLNHPFPTFANNRRYLKVYRMREQLVWCRPSKNVNKYTSRAFF